MNRNIGYIGKMAPVDFATDSYPTDILVPVKDYYQDEPAADVLPSVKPILYVDEPESPALVNDFKPDTWYEVEGVAYLKGKGTPVPFTAIMIDLSNNEPLATWEAPTGEYKAWSDEPDRYAIKFRAKGYQEKTVSFADLLNDADVALSKSFPIAVVAVVAAAAMLYKSKNKKVGKLQTADIWPIMLIVGGAIAFGVVKDILEFLGLWDSKDTKDLNNASTDPNSAWNPNYWKTIKPAGASWSYAITDTTARQWSSEIYNSFGPFNDCEECAIAVCKRCRTKANFSFLADIFQQTYGQDFLTFLRGGWWPQDRLSDADVNIINQYIEGLPKY